MGLDDILNDIGFGKFHIQFLAFLFFIAISQVLITLSPTYLMYPLGCEWKISKTESAGIATGSFLGMLLGSFILGSLVDKYGRTKLFYWSTGILMYFTGVLMLTPNLPWTIALHFCSGIFLSGCIDTVVVLLAEVFPMKYREVGIMAHALFSCIGAITISLLAHFSITNWGWRYFIGVQIIPLVIVIGLMAWIPESPRYLLLVNKKRQCLKVINKIARMNGQKEHEESEIEQPEATEIIFTKEICNNESLKYIFCFCLICFNCGLSFYVTTLLSNMLLNIPERCAWNQNVKESMPQLNFTDNSCCGDMSADFHTNILASSTESPVILMTWALSRYLGRRSVLIICNILLALTMLTLNLCYNHIPEISISIARGAGVSLFPIIYLYGNEIFPTSIRGFAFGFSSIFTRIGCIASAFVVNKIFLEGSFFLGTMILCVMNIFVVILALILLPETKDKELRQAYS